MSAWIQALAGLAIGAAVGYVARYARLCTFGAIEDALMGGDSRRLRVFGLALGIAMLGTQALIVAGLVDPDLSTFTAPALPLVSIALGGIMFGIGMALVGTCGFGSLVRLGSGDLRSLVVVVMMGAAAFAALRGLFADLRINLLESIALPMPDGTRSDLISMTSRLAGTDTRVIIVTALGLTLCWLALGDPRLRRTPRLVGAGVVLGLAIIAGWAATSYWTDEFAGPARPQSLTFVSTIGKALYAALLNSANFANFGVGTVYGVIAGSWLAARQADEFRWEAFDDDREMRRYLGGATLMGIGGILAGGCTIGQGLAAGSVLALSTPLAIAGMIIGARIGIAILVDGSPREFIHRGWISLIGRGGSID
ncbi:MAG: YeeE/YedE family protein [Hyphomicrobiales bacterium]|nr:YeeE/YedE family protein [Hyphomicrobiales bacterium]